MTAMPPDKPYLGLMPFDESDAPLFFGRSREREIIASNLQANRLTILYGPSGCGKTSLIRAGVAFDLRSAARKCLAEIGESRFLPIVYRDWLGDPFVGLAASIEQSLTGTGLSAVPDTSTDVSSDTPTVPLSLGHLLRDGAERAKGRLVLILDQFEDVLLYSAAESFISQLPGVVNDPTIPVNFAFSIREDALASLDFWKDQLPQLLSNRLRIEPMDFASSKEAVTEPAKAYERVWLAAGQPREAAVDRDLADAVVTSTFHRREIGQGAAPLEGAYIMPFATPFIQLVMDALWTHAQHDGSAHLELKTLDALGGTDKIVDDHVNERMKSLTVTQQEAAAAVLGYMVQPSGGKVAWSVPDLAEQTGQPADVILALFEALGAGQSRIFRRVPSDIPTYELFHDALADSVLHWRNDFRSRLAMEAEYLRQRDARIGRRNARLAAAIFGTFIVAYGVGAVYMLSSTNDDLEIANKSLESNKQSLWVANKTLGNLLSSVYAQDRAVPYSAVVVRGHAGDVSAASFSPDGKLIATASHDGTAIVTDLSTAMTTTLKTSDTRDLFLSIGLSPPDGRFAVAGGVTGLIRVWDTTSGDEIGSWLHDPNARSMPFFVQFLPKSLASIAVTAAYTDASDTDLTTIRLWHVPEGTAEGAPLVHSAAPNAMSISPDGSRLAVAWADGEVGLWSLPDGEAISASHPLRHGEAVNSVAFNPEGTLLVTTGGGVDARVWDARTGAAVGDPIELTNYASDAVFVGAHGEQLAVGALDGTLSMWSTRTGVRRSDTITQPTAIQSLAVSPDGMLLASTGSDRIVRVWRVPDDAPPIELRGHLEAITSMSFSPSLPYRLATTSDDDTARIWDIPSRSAMARLRTDDGALSAATYSCDGTHLVTLGINGRVRVWDLATGRQIGSVIEDSDRSIWQIDIDRAAQHLVTVAPFSRARVWNFRSGELEHELGEADGLPVDDVKYISISPDGALVGTVHASATLRLWSTQSGHLEREIKSQDLKGRPLTALHFDPVGRWVAATGGDGLSVWAIAGGKRVFFAPAENLWGVEFSPHGDYLVAASATEMSIWKTDATSSVWRLIRSFSDTDDDDATGTWVNFRLFYFSPDDKQMVVASSEPDVDLRDVRTGDWLGRFNVSSMSNAAMAKFGPDSQHVVTLNDDGTARVWHDDGEGMSVIEQFLEGAAGATTVEFSPDGQSVVVGGNDGVARIFPCPSCPRVVPHCGPLE